MEGIEDTVESGVADTGQDGTTEGGEPITDAIQAEGEPTGAAGLFAGQTPEQIEKQYKDLQSFSTKNSERLSELEGDAGLLSGYGTNQKIADYLSELQGNPRFAEFMRTEQERTIYGDQEIDDEQRKAMDIVEGIAGRIADKKIAEELQSKVAPFVDKYKEGLLENNLSTLQGKFGDSFEEMKPVMADIAQNLPEGVYDSPTIEQLEDLYWSAVRQSGKMEAFAASAHEKRIKAGKSKSMDTPTGSSATSTKKASSIQEAFQQAMASGDFEGLQ